MVTQITKIEETDLVSNSRTTINDNFTSLNTNKQEIEVGKGLSTNDFTDTYKDKLINLAPNYSLTPDLVDSINTTLSEIASNGGGILYLLPGIYLLTSDINIPSDVILEGTSRDSVILDGNGSFGVKIHGSSEYSTGTVSINNGDTTVVGVGTTFTSGMVGQNIWLDGLWYEIVTFTSATEIEIEQYTGINLSGVSYVIATINDKASINKLTITNTTGNGLSLMYTNETIINDIVIHDCSIGNYIKYSLYPKFLGTIYGNETNLSWEYVEGFLIDFSDISYSTVGEGIVFSNVRNATTFNSSINNNTTNGISLSNCSKLVFISTDISYNSGNGIEFITGNNDNQITDGTFNSNGIDGIKITATSDRNTTSQVSVVGNTGYGVNIAAATCDNNILIGVIASGNGTASLNDSGTGTLKSTAVNILP